MNVGLDFIGVTVVFFCHDGKGNFVLSKRGQKCRDEQGTWDPGGGKIEFGDSVDATLQREVKEEYCTKIKSYEFLGFRELHRKLNGKPTHWIGLDFSVLIDPKLMANGEPHKFDAVEWFRLETLPSPLHSQFPKFLELYKDKLF